MAKRKRKFRQLLVVDSHSDCIILMNAVREDCEHQASLYQGALVRALDQGNRAEADKWLRARDETTRCRDKTLARLERIRRRFEDEMDRQEHYREATEGAQDGGISYGYSVDNATCYN